MGTGPAHVLPNSNAPELVINGFGVLGGNALANESYTSNINRINDDLAITHGAAIFHLGADFAYDPATLGHEANLNGQFDFDSLADYLAGERTTLSADLHRGRTVLQRGSARIRLVL